eukprot:TRINITY_DN3744_c0_g2_i1.p1 TRINITY_DN3744_c0_g2~~TRINITY_DN3744_c0_g2_i1.p1  ORF type:complete len:445 (+),score=105.16 TRINITY_DN3744_c0_g2_i1:489-1823(+)
MGTPTISKRSDVGSMSPAIEDDNAAQAISFENNVSTPTEEIITVLDSPFPSPQVAPANESNQLVPTSSARSKPSLNNKDSSVQRVYKGKIKYVEISHRDGVDYYDYVRGEFTLTQSTFFFEPDVDDPLVKEYGIFCYHIYIDLSKIVESSFTQPLDPNVDEKKKAYLVLVCDDKQVKPGEEIMYFMGSHSRIKTISKAMEPWLSSAFEKDLFESLNLDSSVTKSQQKLLTTTSPLSSTSNIQEKIPNRLLINHLEAKSRVSLQTDYEGTGELLSKSSLISPELFPKIRDSVPIRYRDYNWECLFSTSKDGISFTTFFSQLEDKSPTVIVIEDTDGYIFGGFATEPWEVKEGFYGTGESFVFTLKPKFSKYKWTQANDFFMRATKEGIGMGGGTSGRYAFFLASCFEWGTSEVSNTYLNRRLSNTEEFTCTVVEVWGFTSEEKPS